VVTARAEEQPEEEKKKMKMLMLMMKQVDKMKCSHIEKKNKISAM